MRIERTVSAAVLALGLSALLYAQAPGVFDTLEADGDARFNGDVVFTTPSGALVSFQSLVNAGVGLPMTIDSDTSTPGYQCPSGMEEITAAAVRGHARVPRRYTDTAVRRPAVQTRSTLAGTQRSRLHVRHRHRSGPGLSGWREVRGRARESSRRISGDA